MTRWRHGPLVPDEHLDRLIGVALHEQFSGYEPDVTSALGDLRHRRQETQRASRRILPFLPGAPKTVIAVVCIVLATVAALVLPRVLNIDAANTKPVTPAPSIIIGRDFTSGLAVPSELRALYGMRFGPAFMLRGPGGKHVTAELSATIIATKPGDALCEGSKVPGQVRLGVAMTFWGDVSMISEETFSATIASTTSEFAAATLPTPHPLTGGTAIWSAPMMVVPVPSKDLVAPVDVDLSFVGQDGTWKSERLSAAEGYRFSWKMSNLGVCTDLIISGPSTPRGKPRP
jgi:hypothetical protein